MQSSPHGNTRRLPGLLLLIAIGLGCSSASATAKEDAARLPMSGVFLVCKDCLTVRGTFLTDIRGKNIARLNYLFGEHVAPRFSPRDDRILFTSTRGSTSGLWITNRNAEEPKRICDGEQGDWFPDGQRIVFRRGGQIIERSLSTGQESVLSPTGWKSCSWPACAPDGRTTLFLADEGGTRNLYLQTVGQPRPRRLVGGEILGAPRWSPDGAQIVYRHGAHLWTVDADGRNPRQLTFAGGIQRSPAWSPDAAAIAYSQGPGPRGPWQMAAMSIDGKRIKSLALDEARSVLCSDWGVEKPEQRPTPPGRTAQLPPRIRLWEIEQPGPGVSTDWSAFCSEKKGWREVPTEKLLSGRGRGGYAAETENGLFLLLAGTSEALLVAKTGTQRTIAFGLLDGQGKEAGRVESVRIMSCDPDRVIFQSSSRSAAGSVMASWTIAGAGPLLEVTPLENAGSLRFDVPTECVVVPDRFGNDIVANPETCSEPGISLPWAPMSLALFGKGSGMLVLVCPAPGQRMLMRRGSRSLFNSASVAFQNRSVFAGLVATDRVWHLERRTKEGFGDGQRLKWGMPCAGAWRLAVQDGRRCGSAFFSDKPSPLFDGKEVVLAKGTDLPSAPRLALVYLYARTPKTPGTTITPLDLVRDAIGIEGAESALDESGLTGYRRASRPTMWADLGVTLESLRYLFERQLEVQEAAYVRHLCDDLPSFVEGMDQRLEEYEVFAGKLKARSVVGDAALREELAPILEKLRELGVRQRALKNARELLPLGTRIVQCAARESGENQKRLEECCRAIRQVGGPREELLRAYRKAVVEARDAAGIAVLGRAQLAAPVEEIRRLCQGILRDRFYVEADWRGEDYAVPAFWLGPRPYQ